MSPTQRACGSALRLQRGDRGERREHRVTVVGAAAAVQLAVLEHRGPRAEPFAPASHLRLLVEMPVQQHRAIAGSGTAGRNFEEQHRRATGQADNFERQPAHRLARAPTHAPGGSRARCGRSLSHADRSAATWPGCARSRRAARRCSHPNGQRRQRQGRWISSGWVRSASTKGVLGSTARTYRNASLASVDALDPTREQHGPDRFHAQRRGTTYGGLGAKCRGSEDFAGRARSG